MAGVAAFVVLSAAATTAHADPMLYVASLSPTPWSRSTSRQALLAQASPSPANPWSIAVSPDGMTAYVADQSSNEVSVIDLASNTIVGSPIPVGSQPTSIVVSPDGLTVYVVNQSDTARVRPTDPLVTRSDAPGRRLLPARISRRDRDGWARVKTPADTRSPGCTLVMTPSAGHTWV